MDKNADSNKYFQHTSLPTRVARQNSHQSLGGLGLVDTTIPHFVVDIMFEKGEKKYEKSVKNVPCTNKLSFSDWIVNFRKKLKGNLW